jgi:hypothetical protein
VKGALRKKHTKGPMIKKHNFIRKSCEKKKKPLFRLLLMPLPLYILDAVRKLASRCVEHKAMCQSVDTRHDRFQKESSEVSEKL